MTRSLEEELADLIIHNNAGPVSLRREGGAGGAGAGGGVRESEIQHAC